MTRQSFAVRMVIVVGSIGTGCAPTELNVVHASPTFSSEPPEVQAAARKSMIVPSCAESERDTYRDCGFVVDDPVAAPPGALRSDLEAAFRRRYTLADGAAVGRFCRLDHRRCADARDHELAWMASHNEGALRNAEASARSHSGGSPLTGLGLVQGVGAVVGR